MRLHALLLAALVAAAGLAAPPAALADDGSIFGVWRNPKNSVHVDIRPCEAGACGYVIWATPKAKADAREGCGKELVGLQIFRDMAKAKDGSWRGKAFVPDLNATFSGSAVLLDEASFRAKGCLLGNLVCKTQVWRRVEG